MTFLDQKYERARKRTKEYRTIRNETVRFLREDLGMTFGEIGKEFGLSSQRIQQIYAEIPEKEENA